MSVYDYPYPSLSWDYQGIDFAGLPITQALANEMYNDGIRIVGRYLYSIHYPQGKGISAQEAQYYINAGISIFLYYEINTNDALGGFSLGLRKGMDCKAEAESIGVPHGTCIYCCCDMAVTDNQANGVVMEYLEGFKDAFQYEEIDPVTGQIIVKYYYEIGIYGGQNVMNACYNTFPEALRCQAGAWGNKEFSPINIRQWYISYNRTAADDGKIRIANIDIDANGYAKWRNYNVDLVSANDLSYFWGTQTPTPTPPSPQPVATNMPIWFYLKPF